MLIEVMAEDIQLTFPGPAAGRASGTHGARRNAGNGAGAGKMSHARVRQRDVPADGADFGRGHREGARMHDDKADGPGLLLSRKVNERIVIEIGGVECWVMVAYIDRGKVKLGIKAPPEVRITREEVWKKLEAERCRDTPSGSSPSPSADTAAGPVSGTSATGPAGSS